MKHYSPTGRRNRGRPLKRLLDTWDRNGSTSGLTPWQIYDDDDDDDDDNNKDDASNNRGDWDYFMVIQKIREQHTRKTWSQRTTENSHIGHWTRTSESTNVKVQQIRHWN